MSFFRDINLVGINPNLGNRGLNKKDVSNKIFCYLTTTSVTRLTPADTSAAEVEAEAISREDILSSIFINLQISLNTFVIGLLINQIQRGRRTYDENEVFHPDEEVNQFIHNSLNDPPTSVMETIPSLTFVYGNAAAVLPIYTQIITITPQNFLIIIALHKLEANAVENSNSLFSLSKISTNPAVIEILKFYQPLTGGSTSAGEEEGF